MRRIVRTRTTATLTGIGLVAALATGGAVSALAAGAEPKEPITRTVLAQATPENATGQELYLEKVRIAPGAELATHLHEGTQIASISSGVLTYNIVSGTVSVTRADGTTEQVTGPTVIRLRRGDAVTEPATVVHYGANEGKKPVVVLVAALLTADAPLATPVDEEAT